MREFILCLLSISIAFSFAALIVHFAGEIQKKRDLRRLVQKNDIKNIVLASFKAHMSYVLEPSDTNYELAIIHMILICEKIKDMQEDGEKYNGRNTLSECLKRMQEDRSE